MLTLSAPALKTAAASSADRMPPPTVNGTNKDSAVRFTVSSNVPRPSCVAVISSKTISSAPPRACRCASSAGSPASTISTNWTPFTTRPPRTSKQAMMRFVNNLRAHTHVHDGTLRDRSLATADPSKSEVFAPQKAHLMVPCHSSKLCVDHMHRHLDRVH